MQFNVFRNLANSPFMREKLRQQSHSEHILHPLTAVANTGWFGPAGILDRYVNMVNLQLLDISKVEEILFTKIAEYEQLYPEGADYINKLINDYLTFQYMYLVGPKYFERELRCYHRRGFTLSVVISPADSLLPSFTIARGIGELARREGGDKQSHYFGGDYIISSYCPVLGLYRSYNDGRIYLSESGAVQALHLGYDLEIGDLGIDF